MPKVSPATWSVMVQPWRPLAEGLVRRVAALAELREGQEVVSVGGGEGRLATWLAVRLGVRAEAVDPDAAAVARGERAATQIGPVIRPNFQVAEPTDLPHESAVFDAAVVDMMTLGVSRAARVIVEAARVLRPGGVMVVLAPVWHRDPDPGVVAVLDRAFGLGSLLLVEWKRFMLEAGLTDLRAEDVPPERWVTSDRWSVAARGWRVAGWAGIRTALSPAARAFREEIAERRLGFSLIRGVRAPDSD